MELLSGIVTKFKYSPDCIYDIYAENNYKKEHYPLLYLSWKQHPGEYEYLMYFGRDYYNKTKQCYKYLIYNCDKNKISDKLVYTEMIKSNALYTHRRYHTNNEFDTETNCFVQELLKYNGIIYNIETTSDFFECHFNIALDLYGDVLEIRGDNVDKGKLVDIIKNLEYEYPETVYNCSLDKIKCY
jgi:hypothetical protein